MIKESFFCRLIHHFNLFSSDPSKPDIMSNWTSDAWKSIDKKRRRYPVKSTQFVRLFKRRSISLYILEGLYWFRPPFMLKNWLKQHCYGFKYCLERFNVGKHVFMAIIIKSKSSRGLLISLSYYSHFYGKYVLRKMYNAYVYQGHLNKGVQCGSFKEGLSRKTPKGIWTDTKRKTIPRDWKLFVWEEEKQDFLSDYWEQN